MEVIKIHIDMEKMKYKKCCWLIKSYSHFRIGRNIFSFLLFVFSFTIGCKYIFEFKGALSSKDNLGIVLCGAIIVAMFFISITQIAFLHNPSFYKDFFQLDNNVSVKYLIDFSSDNVLIKSLQNDTEIIIKYINCTEFYVSFAGVALICWDKNKQHRKYFFPKFLFSKEEFSQMKQWNLEYEREKIRRRT